MIFPNSSLNGSPRRPNRWLPFLAIVLLLALAWRFLSHRSFDTRALGEAFTQMDLAWLGLAVILGLITYAGRALRWLVMIYPTAPKARFWPLMEATVIGFCASVLLGRAGEFVRPYLIAKQEDVSFASQMGVWFLERITDLLAVLVIFGWALGLVEPAATANVGPEIRWVLKFGGVASAAIGALSLIVLLAFRHFPALAQKRVTEGAAGFSGPVRQRLTVLLDSFAAGLNSTKDSRALFLIFLYSFVEWFLIAACYYCIFRSFGPTADFSISDTLVVLGFVSFGSVIQIPGVGGGTQIVAILVLGQLFGISVEAATAVAMMLWGVGLAIVVPPGLLLAARRGLSWRTLGQARWV